MIMILDTMTFILNSHGLIRRFQNPTRTIKHKGIIHKETKFKIK